MYVKELELLKSYHKGEDALSESFKKFFTIEYCDDRVLEWLDDFATNRIRSDGRRMHVYHDRISDPDATPKQLIRHK